MQLCFDATRFSTGLDGAIQLAVSKGINAIEYTFAPFSVRSSKNAENSNSAKAAGFAAKELDFLKQIRQLSLENNVSFACLNIDHSVSFADKNSNKDKQADKNFSKMLTKMVTVAKTIGCSKLSVSLQPGSNASWMSEAEKQINAWQDELKSENISLLLRLATAKENRNKSLKHWLAMEPQDWRDLIAACPGLSLSFSPADCVWLGIDYLKLLSGIVSGIDHIEAHDIEISRTMLSDSGMYGPLWWRYRIPGKGSVDWTQLIEALKLYGYEGTFSIHLDDEFVEDDFQSLEDALDASIKLLNPLVKNYDLPSLA
jgi:sugar phosphate isomerase/epimerase